MVDVNKVGKRVSKYREQLGLTQKELAVNASIPVGYLIDIEDGIIYPPVGDMIKISRALGQRLGTFMDDQFVPDPLISRKGEREEETSLYAKGGAKGHYHYYSLGKGKTDRHMDPLIIRMEEDDCKEMTNHEGEEFIIVISGKVLLKYGKEEHILETGDSAYYNTVASHYVGAIDGPAEILALLYTPE